MGDLTLLQLDALTEQVNIGFGRAAAVLSTLLGKRILLEAPLAGVYPLETLAKELSLLLPGEITAVQQVFRGRFFGDAYILLAHEHAAALVDLLLGGPGAQRQMTSSDYEALMEVGNIVLNNFLGTFGNLLRTRIVFSLPRVRLETVSTLLRASLARTRGSQRAVLVRTRFALEGVALEGHLVMILNLAALDALRQALDG